MINRPPTRIELRLDEDYSEYEDTIEFRKNLINNSYSGNKMNISNSDLNSHENNYNNFNQNFELINTHNNNNSIFSSADRLNNQESTNLNKLNRNYFNRNNTGHMISEFISEEVGVDEFQEEDNFNFNYKSKNNNSDINMK